MIISVPERGAAELSAEQWGILASSHEFWRLVDAGIVQTEGSAAGRWRLKGTCYVGRALIGSAVLEISEKFQGAFEALVGLGALRAPKVAKAPSPIAKATGSTAVLVSLFIQAVRRYLSGFKKAAYVRIPDAGTIVGGRLDVLRTIRLRAKGMGHQVAFLRSAMTTDLPFNRCIYAALREVERLSRAANISPHDIAMARALQLALAECLPSVLAARPGELARVAAAEADKKKLRLEESEVIALAGAVLDAAGFGGAQDWKRSIERSWFVNLETFFEEAVRRSIRACLGPPAIVESARDRPALFRPGTGRYRANPDVVISEPSGPIAIADAKYKDFTSWPSTADVHELVAHAAAYGVSKALLFYPDDGQFSVRVLGHSATKCSVWAFGITFETFATDVQRALQIVELLEGGD